ncbi:MAG TPA: NAD-dependent malic enzyme [Stellaceae bacterium]|nr:NAD-dependent malic enzyme [Stellaceae bacterium]
MNKNSPESRPADHSEPLLLDLSGVDLLNRPLLNKGTAFTEEERGAFGLHGLLAPQVGTMEEQLARRLAALRALTTPLEKYTFLRDMQDTNEVLFHALAVRHIEEVLPLIYTPTVGEACQRFSHIMRRARGLFLSYPNKDRIAEILAHPRYDRVRVIVVSDGERILGLGDQGAGGMAIPIGKLSLYTACAGIHPEWTLPVLLDVGTDNAERLADPIYVGWRHERMRGEEYDEFVETFVAAAAARWPHVLLQWEDFAGANAHRLLARYRDRLATFNDDIQGTAAVTAGTLFAAIEVTGIPLEEQRIALFGAGAAGTGIAGFLVEAMVEAGSSRNEALGRIYAVDRGGLLVEGMPGVLPAQAPFALPRSAVAGWALADRERIGLFDVVANARPSVLIGVSGQPKSFTERVVRKMAEGCERPVIFPLSNPTERSEASPADLLDWTGGRALVGTGSPFPPVVRDGRAAPVDQTNNGYIFPGVGLGVLASGARRVTEAMFMAAAKALAAQSPARHTRAPPLLPPLDRIRAVSAAVALAVARQAAADGVAKPASAAALEERIARIIWEPAYRPYIRKTS